MQRRSRWQGARFAVLTGDAVAGAGVGVGTTAAVAVGVGRASEAVAAAVGLGATAAGAGEQAAQRSVAIRKRRMSTGTSIPFRCYGARPGRPGRARCYLFSVRTESVPRSIEFEDPPSVAVGSAVCSVFALRRNASTVTVCVPAVGVTVSAMFQ